MVYVIILIDIVNNYAMLVFMKSIKGVNRVKINGNTYHTSLVPFIEHRCND